MGQDKKKDGQEKIITKMNQAKEDMNVSAGSKEQEEQKLLHQKYIMICKYVLLVIGLGALLILWIMDWEKTKQFISQLFRVISPFLAALLIAYFLSPLVEKINEMLQKYIAKGKWKKGIKYLSILLAYLIVITFLILSFTFVIPQLVESIRELVGNVPAMYSQISHFLLNIEDRYPELDLDFIMEKLDESMPDLVNWGTNLVSDAIPVIFTFSVSVVRLVINIILAVMISVYMVSGKKEFQYQMKRLVYALFDEKRGAAVCRTCRECNDIFSSFLIGKALDSLIIGCLCCIIMNILRLPYAVLLSVVVGVTNMIPYFGPFIGAIPGVLIFLCTDPKKAVVFAVMIFVLQQFDGLVQGPRILGQSTGLGPIWVIFAITVGGAYFGILGMFIGVPVVAVIAFLINKGIKYRLEGKQIKDLEKSKHG